MIYVISKTTFGEYEVRDIQCNANWDCCPYSDYVLIPDNLVDDILATQGYCDITLNVAGNEVTAFTARAIPAVPQECCGVNTVLSVNGVKANSAGEVILTPEQMGVAPILSDAEYDGFVPSDGETSGLYTRTFPDVEFFAGETYTVMWDMRSRTLHTVGMDPSVFLGNMSLLGFGADTGEPFVMVCTPEAGTIVFTSSPYESHNIGIQRALSEVPAATAEDEGKMLQVVSGRWQAVDPTDQVRAIVNAVLEEALGGDY